MCGIAGWANLNSDKPPLFGDEVILNSMCNRMRHRGPDSEGLWVGTGVALGMRRLAIIDLKTGEQPVWNEDKSVVAIMNGEIYNFQELKKGLEECGHKFISQTDTEVIPHLYDELGEDFLDVLNGMFAIALWDTRSKKLILARDRFGEKPLYYGIFNDKLYFASEPKVLLAHPEINPNINLEALQHYLSYDYVPAPLSIFEGIYKLPAAHKLIWKNGEFETSRYWNLSFQKDEKKPSVNEASEKLRELLSESVKLRLISDVPLGVLLSGGVDSSAVAAYAAQHSTQKVKTFSIGFEEDSFDESKYAREVATHLGTEHFEERLSVETAGNLITEIGNWLDEPLSDGSLLPTFLLSRFVRKHVTVALGGDGGDEIFAGYPMYYGHKMAKVYDAIPRFVRSGVIEPIVNNLSVSTDNLSFDYKAKRFVSSANYDQVERHHSWFGSFSKEEKQKLLGKNLKSAIKNLDVYESARKLLINCDAEDEIEQMQYLDMNFYLAEDILTKVDRASMAVSLEVRAPFLDHHVAEYAASLPLEYKLKGKTTKYILKKAVNDLLPKSIAKRPKKGFGIPIAKWLKGDLNPLLHDMLSSERLIQQGFFDDKFVQKLISEHEQGNANNYKQLWTLLVFQLWYENFLS
ncbi:MAG: asparagine synthase (glutamine-hydrolyzing) [Acidobacteriota bacterium]|jgi:asparagine synthase (glutamine-hydrolysing)|nr:asparagine synthase (glutamine-hydrolyzing) [Acidobacteriota bacterium]